MSSSNVPASIPEPLPADLKAMLELNQDAQTSSWKHDWHFYIIAMALIGFFVFVALRPSSSGGNQAASLVPFIIVVLTISINLHQAAERRARRRLQLLLEVIRGLQRREDASMRS